MSIEKYLKKQVRLSKYTYIFKKGKYACFFHSLTLKTLIVPIEYCSIIEQLNHNTLENVIKEAGATHQNLFKNYMDKIYENAFVVPIDFMEDVFLNKITDSFDESPDIKLLVLHVTDYCNLSCKYCFIEGSKVVNFKNQNMSRERV